MAILCGVQKRTEFEACTNSHKAKLAPDNTRRPNSSESKENRMVNFTILLVLAQNQNHNTITVERCHLICASEISSYFNK